MVLKLVRVYHLSPPILNCISEYINLLNCSVQVHTYPHVHVMLTWHADCTSPVSFISLFSHSLQSNPARAVGRPRQMAGSTNDLPGKRKTKKEDSMVKKKAKSKYLKSHHNPCWQPQKRTISLPCQCYVHRWIQI